MSTAEVEFRPLTSATWDSLAALFAEGGDPMRCWCTFFRRKNASASGAAAAGNRDFLRGLAARKDLAPGLVAFRDGRAVGWVSLAPREDYERLEHSTVLAPVDDRPVWSIVCFVVSRTERGRGVAAALLDAAIDYAGNHGATLLEAYPVDTEGRRIPAATAYRGTLGMFERAGFRVVTTRRATSKTRPRPIVRREAHPPRRSPTKKSSS